MHIQQQAAQAQNPQRRVENLGPAERIIKTLLDYHDHAYHGRTGIVVPDGSIVGCRWQHAIWKLEGGEKVVYRNDKVGKRGTKTRLGLLNAAGDTVLQGGRVVASWRAAGFFDEVLLYLYKQVAEVWKLDNEFTARWASFQFTDDHRDLRDVLAAFMLVQNRRGDPVLDGSGKRLFDDADYRDVGEAMCLLSLKASAPVAGAQAAPVVRGMKRQRKPKGEKTPDIAISPKHLLRIGMILAHPKIAEINRQLGFSVSQRDPQLGRWPKVVQKWLRFRELNPAMLEGLMKAGLQRTVRELAIRSGYKPATPKFFEIMRWKQKQAHDGRRTIAIGVAVKAAETWVGFTEQQICEHIQATKPNWKRIVGLLPKEVGVTRAVVACAVESGAMSDQDLIVATPTFEQLNLLGVEPVRSRWEAAVAKATTARAAHIAENVKTEAVKEKLAEAADQAAKTAVAQAARDLDICFVVDKSGSMEASLEDAKVYVAKTIQAFPIERVHVVVFDSTGRRVKIENASEAGVRNAFAGIRAGGNTDYGAGTKALTTFFKPHPERDVLIVYIGDEANSFGQNFTQAVRESGLNPVAFGLVHVGAGGGSCVQDTATLLQIPLLQISIDVFKDAYALPRTLRRMIETTPVSAAVAKAAPQAAPVQSLVARILACPLLVKPTWA